MFIEKRLFENLAISVPRSYKRYKLLYLALGSLKAVPIRRTTHLTLVHQKQFDEYKSCILVSSSPPSRSAECAPTTPGSRSALTTHGKSDLAYVRTVELCSDVRMMTFGCYYPCETQAIISDNPA